MSQASELLDNLTDEEVTAYSVEAATEEHIVIDSNRNVIIPDFLKRIAVQRDHNVETITFDCPRYWYGRDLSTMKIYINYLRSDKYKDSFPCENPVIDESDDSIIHFDWVITENATLANGTLIFLVCAKRVDEFGMLVNHWNSELCTDMYISEGMDCVEAIVAENPDLITHLLLRMDAVEEKVELDNIDATLTREGYAADAAAVGARFDNAETVFGNALTNLDKSFTETLNNLEQTIDEEYYDKAEVDAIRNALVTLIDAKPSTLAALGITASATELNYMKGVTSGVQGQLDDKLKKRSISDSSSAGTIASNSTNFPTERDVYYGLPTINGSHSYTSATNIYAPTSVGKKGDVCKSNGSGAPVWESPGKRTYTQVVSGSGTVSTTPGDHMYFTARATVNGNVLTETVFLGELGLWGDITFSLAHGSNSCKFTITASSITVESNGASNISGYYMD